MSLDKEKECSCNEKDHDCGCGHDHQHGHDNCNCDDNDGCGCGHDHEHEHQSITLTFDDDTELECPIIDAFEINEQGYIALLHPVDQNALLYRFELNDDETINIDAIESEEEFELVSKTFLALGEEEE